MDIPLASLCKNLEMFYPAGTEIWPKMHIYGKVKVTGQDGQMDRLVDKHTDRRTWIYRQT